MVEIWEWQWESPGKIEKIINSVEEKVCKARVQY